MGIDIHTLNFLRFCNTKRNFGRTVTIGRQGYHILESYSKDPVIKKMTQEVFSDKADRHYCERLLINYFGADSVDSMDASDYEGATIIHDFNKEIPAQFHGQYDTVIDAGTLEHVFNTSVAFANCSLLCKEGGQIIHILPANNFCGHGFYQFSPEFFFSLYNTQRGYGETEMYMANLGDINHWFRVKPPDKYGRVVVHSSNRTYIMVRTVKSKSDSKQESIYQSDYYDRWEDLSQGKKGVATSLKENKIINDIVRPLYNKMYRLRPSPRMRLNNLNPGLEKAKVSELL